MTPFLLAPSGGATDVCWHDGYIYACWQAGKSVEVGVYATGGARITGALFPCSNGAFPRIASADGSWWLLFRDDGERAVLLKDGVQVWRSEFTCGGNDPVCFGLETTRHTSFAWQRASPTNDIFSGLVGWPSAQLPEGDGRPTGLSHIAAGHVILVDEARGSVAGVTRPCWAGSLVIGEHFHSGALVKATDGRVLHLWPNEDAYVPRLAHDAQTGTYAAITHGRQGVRLAVFTEADLELPAQSPTSVTSPTGAAVLNIWRFLVGSTASWPRTGTHDMDAQESAGSVWYVKGSDPNIWERWGLTDDTIYHVEDHSGNDNQRNGECYQFSDGRWLLTTMRVGQTIECPDNRLRWFRNGAWTTWEPFPYRMVLQQHRTWSDGHEDITVVYDPGRADDTREEFLLSTTRGWEEFRQIDQRTNAVLASASWPTPITKRVSPINARVPWPDARPIPVATPVPPSPEPVPMSWYTDADATAFGQFLTAKYTSDMGRADVDVLGWVRWTMDWSDLRDSGATQARALTVVNRRINAVVGLPDDQWPAGVERPPDPFR